MLSKIQITNFKNIDNLTIFPSSSFNVLTGENNIGKTTIFEAIHLWKMCYDQNIKKDKKGFLSKARNLKFEDMECIRVYHDDDLFPIIHQRSKPPLQISITISFNEIEYNLGFRITKVSNISDAYLQVSYIDKNQFDLFSKMVRTVPNKTVASFIAISESKPIPSIIAREPYMYKGQVLDKIAKGKNNEVLRNKIIANIKNVESHVNNIMKSSYTFTEYDKDKKTYITIKVDNKDIFSYGSGFLQLTEIFASMEFLDPEINILLIDEPDAHLHLKLQRNLIDEFRSMRNCQMFIITHNERFLDEVKEDEILFVNKEIKAKGELKTLPIGAKSIALENLKGCIEYADELKSAKKVIFCEGHSDYEFFNENSAGYLKLTEKSRHGIVYLELDGIDDLITKIEIYIKAIKNLVPSECKFMTIIDTDCIPISRRDKWKQLICQNEKLGKYKLDLLFQDGYGIESTIFSEPEKLAKLLASYYKLPNSSISDIIRIIENTNKNFCTEIRNISTDSNAKMEDLMKEQIKWRSNVNGGNIRKFLDNISLRDMLSEITEDNIRFILYKDMIKRYLNDVHNQITEINNVLNNVPDVSDLFKLYQASLTDLNNFFTCHRIMYEKIYG